MSTPEQEKALATISSLAASLRNQRLSDVQVDLLMVAEHLMTNIAVQTVIHCDTRLVEYNLGEPVEINLAAIPTAGESRVGWQKTTVISKQPISEHEPYEYRYQTAFTGRSVFLDSVVMRKVQSK